MDSIRVMDGVVAAVARHGVELGDGDGEVFEVSADLGVCVGEPWPRPQVWPPEPDPVPETKRLVPKPVVLQRVEAEGGGLEGRVYDLMYAPEFRRELTRWNMPGHPNVYFDDHQTIAVLQLAQATPEQIERIMAPHP